MLDSGLFMSNFVIDFSMIVFPDSSVVFAVVFSVTLSCCSLHFFIISDNGWFTALVNLFSTVLYWVIDASDRLGLLRMKFVYSMSWVMV